MYNSKSLLKAMAKRPPPQEITTNDFTPDYLRKLMPSAKKKSDLQLLKRYKNKCIILMEEAAKSDRLSCCFTLSTFEFGLPLNYNLEDLAYRMCRWLRRKGFQAEQDEDNSLCININWCQESKPEPKSEPPQILTVGPAIPLIRAPPFPTNPLSQAQRTNHPWFSWMNQPIMTQPKTPVPRPQPEAGNFNKQ